MALARTNRAGATSTTNTTGYTTASHTVTNGDLVIAVCALAGSGTLTIAGHGLTWNTFGGTGSGETTWNTGGTDRIKAWWAQCSSTSTGTITFTASVAAGGACWSVFTYTGHDTGTPVSNAIVSSDTNTPAGPVDVSSLSGDLTISAFCRNTTATDATQTGATQIHQIQHGAPTRALSTWEEAGSDSIEATFASNFSSGILGFKINEASAAPSDGVDADIELDAEADGTPAVSDGATATINLDAEAGGSPAVADGGTALVNLDAEAGGSEGGSAGATSAINLDAEANGSPSVSDGDTAVLEIDGEAGGAPAVSDAATATLEINGEADGFVSGESHSDGADADIELDAEGDHSPHMSSGTEPTLANVDEGGDSANVNSRVIPLSSGTADKIIALCRFQATSVSRTFTVPTGWSILGSATSEGAEVCVLYRKETSETTVTLTNTASLTAWYRWVTADVVNGDLDFVESVDVQTGLPGINSIDPGATTGSTSNWLGFAMVGQWSSSMTNAPPSTWPANLPDNQIFNWRNDGVNDPRMAFASGSFNETTTVDPDAFVWTDGSTVNQNNYITVAVPAAVNLAEVVIDGEAGGTAEIVGGVTAVLQIDGEAAGSPAVTDGATAPLTVDADAGGTPALADGATADLSIDGEAGGFASIPGEIPEAGATATLEVGGTAGLGLGATATLEITADAQTLGYGGPWAGHVVAEDDQVEVLA